MKQLFDYFDRTYLINLPERTDRLRQARTELQKIGMELGDVTVSPGVRPTDAGPFASIGVRGNFYAHRALLKDAIRDELKRVVILEDDVLFRTPTPHHVDALLTFMNTSDWDVFYFGYLEPASPAQADGHIVAKPPLTLGGHFYAVNGTFISEMIEFMDDCEKRPRDDPRGGPMCRDAAYNHIRLLRPGLKVFLSVPNLATQRASRSDIITGRLDKIPGLGPLLSAARFLKNTRSF